MGQSEHLHPVTLTFTSPELEAEFERDHLARNTTYWRICHLMALVFFGVFAGLHVLVLPQHTGVHQLVGFGIVAPMFLIGFGLSWFPGYLRRWQLVNVVTVLVTGFGALAMVLATEREHAYFTLTGFVYCYMFGYAVIRTRFVHASVAGAILTLAFAAVSPQIFRGDALSFALGVFYIVGFNGLGMMIAYLLERFTRNEYVDRRQLEQHEQSLRNVNRDLEERVQERTAELVARNRELGAAIERHDVAERERAELQEQLLQSQKMESVGRLAGGVAHDFNNLLTVIGSYSALLLEDEPDSDLDREALRSIRQATDRAAALTRQLLAFSRKQVLQPQRYDINETVQGMATMLRRLVGEDVRMVLDLTDEPATVHADPGQIGQVLLNLVVNARDALPDGGTVTITTAVRDSADAGPQRNASAERCVVLSVSDDGCGIPPEAREHLFEPFFTTKGLGHGTGLGLSTVHGIITQSGGQVTVDSQPGEGATFRVSLPWCAEVDAPSRPEQAALPLAPSDATLLVVEDDPELRKLAHGILDAAGFTVLPAKHGAEALTLWAEHSDDIDLLLTDVVMPDMSGKQLADRLSAERPELQILFMSGYTDNALARHGVLDSAIHFLPKPFDHRTLLPAVHEALRGQRQPTGQEPSPTDEQPLCHPTPAAARRSGHA